MNSPGNKGNAAADKQPSNSAAEKGPSTSSEQPLNKLVNKGDAAVDKQTSNSVEKSRSISTKINSSKGSGTLPSTSSQTRPLADEEKKHIQEVFCDTIRSNATITMQFVRETMKKDAKLIRIEEIEGMLKRVVDYL